MTEAARFPVAVGLKATLMVQLAFTARVAPPLGHVLVSEKSATFVPANMTLEMVSAVFPVLVRLTTCGELVVPLS